MKVRDVMGTAVVTVSPKATYREAARIMYEKKYSGLSVVDDSGKLVGMLSEKDLFKALFPSYQAYMNEPGAYRNHEGQEEVVNDIDRHPIERYMTEGVFTIGPDLPVLYAGALMLAKGIHRLPVVKDDKIVGIVTREDIYGAILKRYLGF